MDSDSPIIGLDPTPSELVKPGADPKLGWKGAWELVKSTYTGWNRDRAPRLGAALAFYTILSLAPMAVVVLAVGGLAFGEQAAEGRLFWEIQGLVGPQGAAAIEALLKSAHKPGSGALATVLGLLTLFFGASNVVNELRDALNTIWQVPEVQHPSSFRSLLNLLKLRAFSFAMVLGIGFLLLVSLVINAWLSAAGKFFEDLLPTPEWVLQIVYALVSFLVITLLFAVLFKVLPDVRLTWKDVGVGAAITSVLFSLGKFLIGLYLGKTSFGNSYGAAGSLVIVVVWVYYSAQIFFLGAEFTCVYSNRYGSAFKRKLEPNPPPEQPQVLMPSEVSNARSSS